MTGPDVAEQRDEERCGQDMQVLRQGLQRVIHHGVVVHRGEGVSHPCIDDPGADDDTTTFDRRWRIQDDTPEADVITVTVEVIYADRLGINRTFSLRTLKSST